MNQWAKGGIAAAVIVSLGVVIALLSNDGNPDPGETQPFQQTWTKSYDQTDCADWVGAMTQDQQWAAAADMLTGARNKGDGGSGVPSDGLITAFKADITTACEGEIQASGSDDIATIGASVYLVGRETYKP